ncbi:MAG: ABC transporter ATP-binding protein [Acidisphaera sp.]|nr:ABC transporter ATP-binding protein [Acidisphaera sp.]
MPSEPQRHDTTNFKLRLTNVSKRYGHSDALVNANLVVSKGECVTLLGPSGSGKTTLLNVVAGLLPPDEGEVWIEDRLATHLPAYERDIGMMFQNYALFPHLTVYDNVAFPLRMRRERGARLRERVGAALAVVSLADKAHRMPSELSGGQQQRISLARALVYEPSIILMDEPLAALDKKLREQLQLEIRRIQKRLGITMLYVTHDQQEALLLSDRICLMNNARIEQVGSPDDLYFRPRSVFAADFIGDSNIFPAEVVTMSAGQACLRGPGGSTLQAATDLALKSGDKVQVMIRPERLRIGTPGQATELDDNCVPATLLETTFLGEATRYYASGPTGETFVSKALAGASSGVAPGEPVLLTADRDSIIVLSPDRDGR